MNNEKDNLPAAGVSRRPCEHTPGPWSARDQGEGPRGKPLGIWISGPNGLPILAMPGGSDKNRANARLVSAAAELLEALKEIISVTDRKHDYWGRAHKAIAKAEGRALSKSLEQGTLASVPPQAETDVCGAPQGEGE